MEEVGSAFYRRTRLRDPELFARRRDGDRRHGQRPPRRADAHGRAAWDGERHGRGADAGRAETQRAVRRRCARRVARAAACARVAARRAAATWPCPGCAARSGPAPRTATRSSASWPRSSAGIPFLGTGGLGERIWSGPGDHGHRARRACPSTRLSTRSCPYARAKLSLRVHPEQDPRGGAGRTGRASRGPAAVRHLARRAGRRDRQGLRRGDDRARPTRLPAQRSRAPGAARR